MNGAGMSTGIGQRSTTFEDVAKDFSATQERTRDVAARLASISIALGRSGSSGVVGNEDTPHSSGLVHQQKYALRQISALLDDAERSLTECEEVLGIHRDSVKVNRAP